MPTKFVLFAYGVFILLLFWDFISPLRSLGKIQRRIQLKNRKKDAVIYESDSTE